jgi:hypothetical protein
MLGDNAAYSIHVDSSHISKFFDLVDMLSNDLATGIQHAAQTVLGITHVYAHGCQTFDWFNLFKILNRTLLRSWFPLTRSCLFEGVPSGRLGTGMTQVARVVGDGVLGLEGLSEASRGS